MPRVLIVAYGNPLRSDDGVAWRAADSLTKTLPASEVEILRLHQLAPELADTVRGIRQVIFVDAALSRSAAEIPGTVRVEEIVSEAVEPARFSHNFSPHKVMGLAKQLYAVQPRAFAVTVVGASFEHGESLSAAVEHSLPATVATIERLVRESLAEA